MKRRLLIFAMAAILVAAIAVSAALLQGDDDTGGPPGGTVATGTQAGAAGTGASSSVSVAPAPTLQQPSEQTWGELLPQLEAAAKASPDDVNLQRKLALAYYNLGRFDQAEAIYRHLLATGEDAALRDRLGNTLRDQGDSAGAEAAYRQAMKDDPTLPSPYANLAELLWRQGQDEEALRVIDQGLAAVPQESRAGLEAARATVQGGGL